MDEEHTSTFASLGNLSLADDFLADENYADQSNILDASFEYENHTTQHPQHDTDVVPPAEAGLGSSRSPDEYAYQGSMRPSLPPSTAATATTAITTTHPPSARMTPPSRASGGAQGTADEDDELGADASEDERKRWGELSAERDRLRAVNAMLLQVSAGFDSVEGKMEVSNQPKPLAWAERADVGRRADSGGRYGW